MALKSLQQSLTVLGLGHKRQPVLPSPSLCPCQPKARADRTTFSTLSPRISLITFVRVSNAAFSSSRFFFISSVAHGAALDLRRFACLECFRNVAGCWTSGTNFCEVTVNRWGGTVYQGIFFYRIEGQIEVEDKAVWAIQQRLKGWAS